MNRRMARLEVLALGSGLTMVGVLRSLHDARILCKALPHADPVTRSCRYYRAGPDSLRELTPENVLKRLESLPSDTVLLPCTDAWSRSISAIPDGARKRNPVAAPPHGAIDVLTDKGSLGRVLRNLNLPHPYTFPLGSVADLDMVPDQFLASAFLKPADSQPFFARYGVKGFMISTRDQAASLLLSCIEAGLSMTIQEYVPGPPDNHYYLEGFIDRHRVTRVRLARRRLRMYPPDFGNSTVTETVVLKEIGDAPDTLDTLFGELGFTGIFSAEFKKDSRSGEMKLIEINARPWWFVEFVTRCGANLCEMAVRDAVGLPVATIDRYAIGKRLVYPYYDFHAVKQDTKSGFLRWASWLGLLSRASQPLFRWSDPMPAVSEVAAIMKARLQR